MFLTQKKRNGLLRFVEDLYDEVIDYCVTRVIRMVFYLLSFLAFSNQQLSSDWLSLASIVFEPIRTICNLHRCYRNLNCCYVKVAHVFSQSELSYFYMYIIKQFIFLSIS